jgi:hypothetical protein
MGSITFYENLVSDPIVDLLPEDPPMIKKSLRLAVVLAALAITIPVTWAGGGGGGPGGVGFGGGVGGFTRVSTIETIHQQVGFTDDEWSVIQPKLQKVLDAQTSLRVTTIARGGFGGGGMGGIGGVGGMGGGGAGPPAGAASTTPVEPVQLAQQELAAALQVQGTANDLILARLKALRDARAKAKEKLTQAQDDLKKVLTIRQEAMLVNLGYLE